MLTRAVILDRFDLGNELNRRLGLQHAGVAIAFMDEPPSNVSRVKKSGPAGCLFWKLASDGETFYTTSEDHQDCAIGAYTHGVKLGAEKPNELQGMLCQMIGLNYLRETEIPKIPRREKAFAFAAYAPLKDSPFR